MPAELADEVRLAATRTVAAPVLLKRARAAYQGRLMLMKGLEVAVRYPDPASRYFQDLDLLADEPEAAQRSPARRRIRRAPDGPRLLRRPASGPLVWPGVPLVVELHRRPNCPEYLTVAAARRADGDGRPQRDRDRRAARAGAARARVAVGRARMDTQPARPSGRSHRPRGDAPTRRTRWRPTRSRADGAGTACGGPRCRWLMLCSATVLQPSRSVLGRAIFVKFVNSPCWRTTSPAVGPCSRCPPTGAARGVLLALRDTLHRIQTSAGPESSTGPRWRHVMHSRTRHSTTVVPA